jgi:hypothetical protein
MDLKSTNDLERYSFLWSEFRLIMTVLAFLLGGVPVLSVVLPFPALFGLVSVVLRLAWLFSGVVSVYLLYRWHINQMRVFGGQSALDLAAFFICVVPGINLGLVSIIGRNIGLSLISSPIFFRVMAIVYLVVAIYLYARWNASGKKIFS